MRSELARGSGDWLTSTLSRCVGVTLSLVMLAALASGCSARREGRSGSADGSALPGGDGGAPDVGDGALGDGGPGTETSDGGGEPGCGESGEPCCPDLGCADGLVCGAGIGMDLCMRPCTPTACAYGDEAGVCVGLVTPGGIVGACRAADETRRYETSCARWNAGCATSYGVSEPTICAPSPFTEAAEICLEICVIPDGECSTGSFCLPWASTEAGGVCAPAS